jgi:hypothetical protein
MATGDGSIVRRISFLETYYVDAATSASFVSRDLLLPPPGWKLASVKSAFAVASTSGTFKVRKITDTSAPGAAASSTVLELLSAANALSGTANTITTATLTTTAADLRFKAGDRLAVLFAGTFTNLVGGVIQFEFIPLNKYAG